LFVTSLVPRSVPGSEALIAEVRGIWIENGRAVHAVAVTRLRMPALASLGKVAAVGSDVELDPLEPPIQTPSVLFEDVELAPI